MENLNPIAGGNEYRVPLNTGNPLEGGGSGQPRISDSDSDNETGESEGEE